MNSMNGAQYNSLPRMAREQADRMFCRSRNRPAPGDRYWYRYRIEEPEPDRGPASARYWNVPEEYHQPRLEKWAKDGERPV